MGRDLTELNKLEEYLKVNGFEYQREDQDNTLPPEEWRVIREIMGEDAKPMDKHQIIVFDDGVRSWDAICHRGSYGVNEGLLEIMGDIVDEEAVGDRVEGWLTAEEVIERIEAMK